MTWSVTVNSVEPKKLHDALVEKFDELGDENSEHKDQFGELLDATLDLVDRRVDDRNISVISSCNLSGHYGENGEFVSIHLSVG